MTSPETLADIAEQYHPMYMRAAFRVVGDYDLAKDLVATAVLRALEKLDTFKGTAQLQTWLYRIVVNQALQHRRAVQNRRTVELETCVEPSYKPDLDAPLFREEEGRLVRAALAGIPKIYRDALYATYFEGLNTADAAERLGISIVATKSRIMRGKLMLRDRLLN